MRQPAEFRAGELVMSGARREEDDFRSHPGHRVLFHTKVGKKEAVDDVLRMQADVHGVAERHRDVVQSDDIVFTVRIRRIQAQRIAVVVHELRIGSSEHAIRTWIADVPHELLCGDFDLDRVGGRDGVEVFRPDRHADREHAFFDASRCPITSRLVPRQMKYASAT